MRILKIGEKRFDRYLSAMEERIAEDPLRLEREVRSILRDVKKRGDKALLRYTERFDHVRLLLSQLEVEKKELTEARRRIPRDFLETLKKASRRIRKFHELSKK